MTMRKEVGFEKKEPQVDFDRRKSMVSTGPMGKKITIFINPVSTQEGGI